MSKAAIGLLILLVVGWLPMRSLLEATSTEAVVNARLVTLRAPIEGDIEAPAGINVGTEIAAGLPVLRIVNRRAERGRLDDLTPSDRPVGERTGRALPARITELTVMQADSPISCEPSRRVACASSRPGGGEIASELAAAACQPRRGPEGARARRADGQTRAAFRPRRWNAIGAMPR